MTLYACLNKGMFIQQPDGHQTLKLLWFKINATWKVTIQDLKVCLMFKQTFLMFGIISVFVSSSNTHEGMRFPQHTHCALIFHTKLTVGDFFPSKPFGHSKNVECLHCLKNKFKSPKSSRSVNCNYLCDRLDICSKLKPCIKTLNIFIDPSYVILKVWNVAIP